MKKKTNRDIYKNSTFTDVLVVILGILAFATLIFVIKIYKDRSVAAQELLAQSKSVIQEFNNDNSLNGRAEFLSINEVNQVGWIELYYQEQKTDMDLSKCYITVNGKRKYTFNENSVITSEELLCIDGLGPLGQTQQDIIGIFDENGNILKSMMLPRLGLEESYGCSEDGDIHYSYMTASKGTTNSEGNLIQKDELIFSVPGGFYDESFSLELTAGKDSKIYYTLDGTEPTPQSEIYTEPIIIKNRSGSNMIYATSEGIDYLNSYKPASISMGTIVKAIAIDDRGSSSEVICRSYFVGLKKASDFADIPVLSIVTSPENLFDYFDGIYVSGRSYEEALAKGEDSSQSANYRNGWEKEVQVEYFEPQKDKTFEGKMSIRIMNDSTITSPQKSFELTADGGAYTGSSLSNYYNVVSKRLLVQTNRKDNNYKIREYLANQLLLDTNIATPDIMPCIVFINGEYWGGYMLRAEYDEQYLKRHYGVMDEVLLAQNGAILNLPEHQSELNELYDYLHKYDLRDPEHYEWVKAHLDVQNYLEMLCVNMYVANAEFDPNSVVMWRTLKELGPGYSDGKWRFLMPALDNTMANGMAGRIATSSINSYLQSGILEDVLFRSLLRNDEFKDQLLRQMTEISNEFFTMERVYSSTSQIALQLKKMTVTSFKRFISNQGDSFYIKEVDKIEEFFQQRGRFILRYTEEVINGRFE